MDDGRRFRNRRGPGHDIGPGEERLQIITQENTPRRGHYVEIITGMHTNANGETELETERAWVQDRAYTYEEPLDQSGSSEIFQEDRRYAQYYSEAARLDTFQMRWDDNANFVTKEDLARDGFIYKGPSDRVLCVFCLHVLRNWEQGDIVVEEHRKHYPYCPFVRGLCDRYNIPLENQDIIRRGYGVRFPNQTAPPVPVQHQNGNEVTTVGVPPSDAHHSVTSGRSQVQEQPRSGFDVDVNSPKVVAVMEEGYSVDQVARALQALRLESDTEPSSQEILKKCMDFE